MTPPTTSALRRLPVPDCQPPFDDEIADRSVLGGPASRPHTHDGTAVQGTLALAFVLPTGLPATPEAPPGLRLVPAPVPTSDPDGDFGPQPTGRHALPDPRGWSGRFVQALVEVMAGDRPLAQLVRWTSTEVYDLVGARASSTARARAAARATVRSVHVTEPDDGVAEVAATVRRGPRLSAVALRLEGLDGRWQCTALELG